MNRSVVSFHRPMKTLTIDGSGPDRVGELDLELCLHGDRPSATAASFWPLSTACRPPLRTSAM